MTDTIRLRVVTPLGSFLDQTVQSVTARSDNGEFCLLPEHRPVLASLTAGRFLVEEDGGNIEVYVTDTGFFEGGPDHVNVITQHCVLAKNIDVAATSEDVSSLEKSLAVLDEKDELEEEEQSQYTELKLSLNWALAKLEVAQSL